MQPILNNYITHLNQNMEPNIHCPDCSLPSMDGDTCTNSNCSSNN
jgi:hypothetical protein